MCICCRSGIYLNVMIIPAGGLLVVSLPLVFAVQVSLHLRRRRLLTLHRQRGRLAAFAPSVCARRRDGTRLLRAPLRHSVHLSVHPILPTHRHQLPNTQALESVPPEELWTNPVTITNPGWLFQIKANSEEENKVNMNSYWLMSKYIIYVFLHSTFVLFS